MPCASISTLAPNWPPNCWPALTAHRILTPKKAWAFEIERRVAAIEAGAVTLEPWSDVKRRIEKEILGR